MTEPLFLELSQGWSKGLKISFEGAKKSSVLNKDSGFFYVDQVHGADVYEVNERDVNRTGPLAKADGLIARGSWFKSCSKPLLVRTADCIPLVLVSAEEECVALLHAGWRGLQQGIHTKLFRERRMSSDRAWAWVGPSLAATNFQVREDMWSQFEKKTSDDVSIFLPTSDPSVRLFNAWALLERDLKDLGVALVYQFEEDTFTNKDFFSYRRTRTTGDVYGSNFSWVGFRSIT